MAYEGKCGSCGYYEFEGDAVKGYCSWYRCYYYPNDTCEHQNQMQTQTTSSSSSLCYITTIICDKLGLEDDCPVLNTLRDFRNNALQKNCKYFKILFEYDVIGPKIAEMIKNDSDTDKELWIQIYNFYLSATANFHRNGKTDEAVQRYEEMVVSLKEYYGIKEEITEIAKGYDASQGGHGKLKLLEQ